MFKVFMISSGYDGCCYLRLYLPAMHNGYWIDKPLRNQDKISIKGIKEKLIEADIVVFHRAEEQEYHDLARLLKADGKKIVMDNDDTFKVETYHPLANFNADGSDVDNLKRRENNLKEFVKMCDLVTTTTKTLAEEYREDNPNVVVLPNYVDPMDWDEPLRNEWDKVRIGIVGSVAMAYDYRHVKDMIKSLGDRDDIELVLFGLGDLEHRKNNPNVTKAFTEEYDFWDSVNKVQIPWVHNNKYQETLNEARLDIMLIPRADNYFNRCKSNVKFLEAAMCEIPVIAQSFTDGPYEEVTPDMGMLIKDNEWIEQIDRLVKDKELRREMGRKAKEYVLKNYNIEDHYQEWESAYSKLCEQ